MNIEPAALIRKSQTAQSSLCFARIEIEVVKIIDPPEKVSLPSLGSAAKKRTKIVARSHRPTWVANTSKSQSKKNR